jgi:hypothetical protein
MPFASDKQRKFLEMLSRNPKRAKESGKSEKDIESIKRFTKEAEQLPQPKLEKVPQDGDFGKKKKFSKIMGKIKKD